MFIGGDFVVHREWVLLLTGSGRWCSLEEVLLLTGMERWRSLG